MPTFIVKNNPGFNKPVTLDDEDLHHLIHSMRAKVGDCFSVTDNDGNIARLKIKKVRPFESELIQSETSALPLPITLCLSLFQMNRLEWAVQKLCELYVQSIQFIVSERSQLRELSHAKMERLNKIVVEAQKQCGRAYPMTIHPCMNLEEFDFDKKNTHIVGAIHPSANKKITIPKDGATFIFIGPEGDFTVDEYNFLLKKNCLFIDLGNIILKSETAAILLAGLVKYNLEISHV